MQFYFDFLQGKNLDYVRLCLEIKGRFITAEHTRALLIEWDSLSFKSIIAKGGCSSDQDYLEKLVSKLQDTQSLLPSEYKSEEILKNRLLNSVKDIEACQLAYYKPASTLQGVISDIHASLAITSIKIQDGADSFFVDRTFHTRNQKKHNHKLKDQVCFVCKRRGCWSPNHRTTERIKALRKDKVARQFIASISKEESSNSESEDELNEIEELSAHVLNITDNDENIPLPTNVTPSDKSNPKAFLADLFSISEIHALTMQTGITRYDDEHFYGIIIDTGCAKASTGGLKQYKAYCRHIGIDEEIDSSKKVHYQFGISGFLSLGTAKISFPIEKLTFNITVHILENDVPLLLSLFDMDCVGVHYNNLENKLIHPASGMTANISRQFGHPFITWNSPIQCYFTETEIRRLHKRFGHPHQDKLFNLLRRADVGKDTPEMRKLIETITKMCSFCQKYAQKQGRFKFSLSDDKDFNHTVFVDIFYLDGKAVLRVVDQATRYQAVRWLSTITADSVWRALRMCWIDVYVGPPDIVTHDAGKQFMSKVFQSNTSMMHISTKAVPVECPNAMSLVERYHVPVRRAYRIIRDESPSITLEECLQMAIKSINDSIGPDGLVLTLLVYGCLPLLSLPLDKPSPGSFERAVALKSATNAMSKYFSKSQISAALRTRNGLDVTDIHSAPLGCKFLVYLLKLTSGQDHLTSSRSTGKLVRFSSDSIQVLQNFALMW